MIHLDTNFLIRASVTGSAEGRRLSEWIKKNEEIAVSAVAWMEFMCGPVTREQAALAARIVGAPIPFTSEDATRAAAFFNATGRRRSAMVDCMIAAAAVGGKAPLATSNAADFDRFEELEILTA
jgi:predicted nucleic acid-binding protein